jgi:short-subunit dehydrogenase
MSTSRAFSTESRPRCRFSRRQGAGHFVHVVSTADLKIAPLQGVYAATKNAVRTLTEALRQEAGETLRVTSVSPGFVHTDFADSMTDPNTRAAILEPARPKSPSPPKRSPAPSRLRSTSRRMWTSMRSSSGRRRRGSRAWLPIARRSR